MTRIGLVFDYGLDYYREILRGIKAFAEARPRWAFTPMAPEPRAVAALRASEHDGLIAHVFGRPLARALEACGRPVVNVSGVLPDLTFPRVGVDHEAVGRLAAEHLLGRGLRRFGFVGYARHAFSIRREAGFRDAIEGAGFRVASYRQREASRRDPTGLWRWDEGLVRWLAALSGPVGILASHDPQGVQLAEACRRAGLTVPDDVALVGVDNDDLLCGLARPPLSSVALPAERIGFEAAALLDRLMTRPRARPPAPLELPPTGVVTRPSTDVLALDDPELVAAIRFIREGAHRPLQVADVLAAVPTSRRSLERRFRAAIGRGIGEEIRRAHLERARTLLAETDLPMAQVAVLAGFSESKHLSVAFRQATGTTPTAYRRQSRAGA